MVNNSVCPDCKEKNRIRNIVREYIRRRREIEKGIIDSRNEATQIALRTNLKHINNKINELLKIMKCKKD